MELITITKREGERENGHGIVRPRAHAYTRDTPRTTRRRGAPGARAAARCTREQLHKINRVSPTRVRGKRGATGCGLGARVPTFPRRIYSLTPGVDLRVGFLERRNPRARGHSRSRETCVSHVHGRLAVERLPSRRSSTVRKYHFRVSASLSRRVTHSRSRATLPREIRDGRERDRHVARSLVADG